MKVERRFDGDTWTWCAVTGKGEVLAEFASHDDAQDWMRQRVRATQDKTMRTSGHRA